MYCLSQGRDLHKYFHNLLTSRERRGRTTCYCYIIQRCRIQFQCPAAKNSQDTGPSEISAGIFPMNVESVRFVRPSRGW